MVNKSDRERCHLCGRTVYIAPSADPHRRVLCPTTCARRFPDDVETGPAPYRMGKAFAGLEKGGPKLQLSRGASGVVRIYLTRNPAVHIHLMRWPLPPEDMEKALAYDLNLDTPGLSPEQREDFKRWVREANARKLEQAKTKT